MSRRGFTLLELMVVLMILVVIGGLVAPSLRSLYPDWNVESAADNLKGAFERTRANAMNTGTPYRFTVLPGKGNYRGAPDLPEYWDGSSSSADSNGLPVLQDALPKGIAFESQNGDSSDGAATILSDSEARGANWVKLVTFLPDGTARVDDAVQTDGATRGMVEVRLRTSGATPLYVTIRTLTGAIRIRRTSSLEGQ